MSLFRGITLRVALLGWTVTLVTLVVFVVVIIPQQESEFRTNLESKAQGIAASIKAVAAGAAVSEDYSVVVDQAMQVLAGDEAIRFVVVTKNDGFSVVTDRSNWRTETLGESWRPAVRRPLSSIRVEPLFGTRVFHYSTPFDYSGIEWGWVHVGLSLDAYDQSVARSWGRTLMLGLFCSVLSLLISLVYAKRLVTPIHQLQSAVNKVAAGDLRARADVRTRDEVGTLAAAFNSMTATVLARNMILESVGFAAQELLRAAGTNVAMKVILARMGRATGSSRAYLFENETCEGVVACSLREEWTADGIAPKKDRWQRFPWVGGGLDVWGMMLSDDRIVEARAATLEEGARQVLDPSIKSLILIPVWVDSDWWGFLGFDDCAQERDWSEAEKESLRAVANMLGATIIRHRAQNALVEANNTLEQRVAMRTQELQEQVIERDRAHAELAAAQQRLVDMSRHAGMAEVATGVLHNVGNVLNSVNVAATLVLERVQQSRIDKLASVVEMLREHENDLGTFLKSDAKGTHVLPYLAKLSDYLLREREGMVSELGNLSRHVGHIKEIVAAQQGYATTAGFIEKVSVRRLMDDALALSREGLERHGVRIEVRAGDLPEILTDKHKVLQIVLNLIRNAKDATKASGKAQKLVRLEVARADEDRIRISVADNGIGLRPEDLQRVFQHGFTTKKEGHGFGLHSGALAAKDLGGSLSVQTDGPGQGAVFTLELPIRRESAKERSARS
ncbi:MAG: HAMP domain-containing protein [Bryobacterales bacterium]|nr:HAMP domain-containing protein [Bryobacterales bacterium]